MTHAGAEPVLHTLQPFVDLAGRPPADVEVQIQVEADDRWPVVGPDLTKNFSYETDQADTDSNDLSYQRHDLVVHMDAARTTARAVTDGTPGALMAVIQLVLQAALLPRGGLMIHGSAGVARGSAWLVPGPSGAGKSTVAREAGYESVLSDEIVALRRHGAGFMAWGTPFWSQGRTLPLNPQGAPLGLLARPVKANAVAMEPLVADEALAWLLRCVTLYEEDPAAREAAFELACELVESVPTVSLAFPREGPWLPAALKAFQTRSSRSPSR